VLSAKRALPVALILCVLQFTHQHAEAGSKTVVFAHVNVVPMDGDRILTDQDVTVVDDRISSIEPTASAAVPKDAQVVDASGKFLMPGLGEMHAHLPEPSDPQEYMRTTVALYVANGVTSVRCMRGFPNHLAARQDVISGKLLGPSLFLAGPGLGGDSVKSPEDGVKHVLRQKSEGWDNGATHRNEDGRPRADRRWTRTGFAGRPGNDRASGWILGSPALRKAGAARGFKRNGRKDA
jgi:imidazolonepropionase-like amidohydrolase